MLFPEIKDIMILPYPDKPEACRGNKLFGNLVGRLKTLRSQFFCRAFYDFSQIARLKWFCDKIESAF